MQTTYSVREQFKDGSEGNYWTGSSFWTADRTKARRMPLEEAHGVVLLLNSLGLNPNVNYLYDVNNMKVIEDID